MELSPVVVTPAPLLPRVHHVTSIIDETMVIVGGEYEGSPFGDAATAPFRTLVST